MHSPILRTVALLSTSILAAAQHGDLPHRPAAPPDLHARDPPPSPSPRSRPSPQTSPFPSPVRSPPPAPPAPCSLTPPTPPASPPSTPGPSNTSRPRQDTALRRCRQQKGMLLEAVPAVESDDTPQEITIAELRDGGLESVVAGGVAVEELREVGLGRGPVEKLRGRGEREEKSRAGIPFLLTCPSIIPNIPACSRTRFAHRACGLD